MCSSRWIRPSSLLVMLSLATFLPGCSKTSDAGSEESRAEDVVGLQRGDRAEILLPTDSVLSGIAVVVRRGDGSTVPALSRGPPMLAREASGGDYEFHEDSLPRRVRLLQPGEELRAPSVHLP
jgi:hypothetical protein